MPSDLPKRAGTRPATTPTNPHTPLGQQPTDPAIVEEPAHAMLPLEVASEAVEAGWAEPHPVARMGLIPRTAAMLHAPRDQSELDVVEALIRASHAFARPAS